MVRSAAHTRGDRPGSGVWLWRHGIGHSALILGRRHLGPDTQTETRHSKGLGTRRPALAVDGYHTAPQAQLFVIPTDACLLVYNLVLYLGSYQERAF